MTLKEDLAFYRILKYRLIYWQIVVLLLLTGSDACTPNPLTTQQLYDYCLTQDYCKRKYPLDNLVLFRKTFSSIHPDHQLNFTGCNQTFLMDLFLLSYDGKQTPENPTGFPFVLFSCLLIVFLFFHTLNEFYHYRQILSFIRLNKFKLSRSKNSQL